MAQRHVFIAETLSNRRIIQIVRALRFIPAIRAIDFRYNRVGGRRIIHPAFRISKETAT
jgi:hypothetical protein